MVDQLLESRPADAFLFLKAPVRSVPADQVDQFPFWHLNSFNTIPFLIVLHWFGN
jgi:hypothetical protein